MHTNIQRCTYILAYMLEFIHKNKPPIITSATDNRKMIFIHSFRIFLWRLFKFTGTQSRFRPQQLTLCRSLHAESLQVSEGLAQGPWRGGQRHRFKQCATMPHEY